jgi:AcrR family transcriptional regulator
MLGLANDVSGGSRRQVLDAARQVFAVRAYDEVTVADVAVVAGVSVSGIYEHFVNKRELYLANLQEWGEQLIQQTRPADGDPLGPLVRYSLSVFLDFVEDNPVLFKAVTLGGPGVDEVAHEIPRRVERRFIRRILNQVGVTRPSPQIRVEMAGWMAFVRGSAVRWLDFPGLSKDELLGMQVRHLMNALRMGGASG